MFQSVVCGKGLGMIWGNLEGLIGLEFLFYCKEALDCKLLRTGTDMSVICIYNVKVLHKLALY